MSEIKIKKMNKLIQNIYVSAILLITLLLYGCPEKMPMDDAELKLINNSDDTLIFYFNITDDNNIDTLFCNEFPWSKNTNWSYGDVKKWLIMPHSTYIDAFNSNSLKDILSKKNVYYFIFNYRTVRNLPWSNIYNEYKIVKRADFNTWADFENCGFIITIP